MTPLQRTARQMPCRSQNDRLDGVHAEWSREGNLAALTLLTLDVETERYSYGGRMVPRGMGPAAWHASVTFHDASTLPADLRDFQPDAPVISVHAYTQRMHAIATKLLTILLDGVGADRIYDDFGFDSVHRWRIATALERELVTGRPD